MISHVFIGALALGTLYLLLQPESKHTPVIAGPRPSTEQQTSGAEAVAIKPANSVFVEGRQLISTPSTLHVGEGEQVTLRITADSSDEFHLHGYDLMAKLSPEQEEILTFVAEKPGRFEFELERSHTELGALEVLPQ